MLRINHDVYPYFPIHIKYISLRARRQIHETQNSTQVGGFIFPRFCVLGGKYTEGLATENEKCQVRDPVLPVRMVHIVHGIRGSCFSSRVRATTKAQ